MRVRFVIIALLLVGACRTGRNYVDPVAPRWLGPLPVPAPTFASDTVRVVSFNIQLAERIDSALAVLDDAALRHADIVLLQEMDADATARIAAHLGMGYVYYPAINYFKTGRDFGNAILSRWPMDDDAKVILPNTSRFGGTHRIATAATIDIAGTKVRAYSTHLGTIADMGPNGRREQLRSIIEDAAQFEDVIIGGDMNSGTVGKYAREAGYSWPTAVGYRTAKLGQRYDHFFVRGLVVDSEGAGMVEDNRGSSDHRPIWMVGVLPGSRPPAVAR